MHTCTEKHTYTHTLGLYGLWKGSGVKSLEIVLAPEDQGIAVRDKVVPGNKRKHLGKEGGSAPAGWEQTCLQSLPLSSLTWAQDWN